MTGCSTHHVLGTFDRLKLPSFTEATSVSNLPADSDQLIELGKQYLADRLVLEAEHCFTKALQVDHGLTEAHYWLGCLYNRQGQYNKAAVQLHNCLAAQPRNGLVYAELGLVYFKQGRIREARALWQQGLVLASDSAQALTELLEHMSFYVTLDGEDKVITNLCSMATYAAGEKIAYSYLERAYILEPYNPIVFKTLAKVLATDARDDEAVSAWEEAVRLRPYDSHLQAKVASYYLDRNKPELAQVKAQAAVKLSPNNANYRLLLARIQERLENLDGAEQQLRVAHRLEPEQPAINFELGRLLCCHGKNLIALPFLIKAIRAGYHEARGYLATIDMADADKNRVAKILKGGKNI